MYLQAAKIPLNVCAVFDNAPTLDANDTSNVDQFTAYVVPLGDWTDVHNDITGCRATRAKKSRTLCYTSGIRTPVPFCRQFPHFSVWTDPGVLAPTPYKILFISIQKVCFIYVPQSSRQAVVGSRPCCTLRGSFQCLRGRDRFRSQQVGQNEATDVGSREMRIPGLQGLTSLRVPTPRPPSSENGESRRPSGVDERRDYLTTTCPSYNKLDPPGSSDLSSRAILSKFFSRPDDDAEPYPWLNEPTTSRSTTRAISPRIQSEGHLWGMSSSSRMPSELTRHHESSTEQSIRMRTVRSSSSEFPATRPSPTMFGRSSEYGPRQTDLSDRGNYARQYPEASLPAHDRRERTSDLSARRPIASTSNYIFPPGSSSRESGEEFRCRNCNRKCKSQISFQKHAASCTHREGESLLPNIPGPLTLECRYCKRPYTYIGYLSKHEAECVKTLGTKGGPNR
ncbi:uncharacterized protein MELLADRAFT_93044 [Melampsora larici-populina 98AG31]|uniref:C2H2-type domain-containing protein n=1 Tax=Melampsora larici-populina (strain 98AG31 / pathotype 3-4-7) TaxID=747676 RepID=F4S3Q6_MELLP|nr:uncharacterized protein MELLADRAFT_93044 [Melampsora larici-populina 98AG31]EGG00714.1 hypothetical protein MELLADRAFT_93044 [Melampsora larici-populina 98AG31]